MSTIQNDIWVEAAYEDFEVALSEGNIAMAKLIIADMFDAGFTDESRTLAKRLRYINV